MSMIPAGRRAVARMLPISLAAVLVTGCSLIDQLAQLTEPELPTVARTLSLSVSDAAIPVEGGDVEVTARLLANGMPEPGVKVTFLTTAGEFIPDATATTDDSGIAKRILRTTVAATVSARVDTAGLTIATANEVAITVGGVNGNVAFELDISPRPATIGAETTFEVTATRDNGAWATGRLAVEFGDGDSANFDGFNGRQAFTHTYREASAYNLALTLVDSAGNETRRIFEVKAVDTSETILELEPDALETTPGTGLGFRVRPVKDTGRTASGKVVIDWGDGRSARLGQIDTATRVEHAWRDVGSYRVLAELTGDDGKTVRASVRISVIDPVTINSALTASSSTPTIGDQVNFTFTASRSDGKPTSGSVAMDFGDGTGATANVSGNVALFSRAYTSAGQYLVTASFDDGDGHQSSAAVTVSVSDKPVPPPPPPPGGGGGGGSDAIDPFSFSIVGTRQAADARGWPATANITVTAFREAHQEWTPNPGWPSLIILGGPSQGVLWVIREVNGKLEGAPMEWFLPGQTRQFMTRHHIAGISGAWPTWSGPQSGEVLYFFLSTPAWVGQRGITDERSNIVRVVWGL